MDLTDEEIREQCKALGIKVIEHSIYIHASRDPRTARREIFFIGPGMMRSEV